MQDLSSFGWPLEGEPLVILDVVGCRWCVSFHDDAIASEDRFGDCFAAASAVVAWTEDRSAPLPAGWRALDTP